MKQRNARNTAIFLVPSMITIASMCSGFYAMVQAVMGYMLPACVAVFVSMILDGLDGRVARLTKTSSAFGAELDSLADMVAFGVAPSVIMYLWYSKVFGSEIGLIVSFIYCASSAIRLARFNANMSKNDKFFFNGLPSPTAAGLVIGYIYLVNEYRNTYEWLLTSQMEMVGVAIILISSISMVSNIKFYSFKEFHFHRKAPFPTLLLISFLLILVLNFPDLVIYSFFIVYVVVSYLMWMFRIRYK